VKISGFVSYVGKSSMEISIELVELVDETPDEILTRTKALHEKKVWPNIDVIKASPDPILTARFTMVGRDSVTKGSARVNTLDLVTDYEKELFARGEVNKKTRMDQGMVSLTKVEPDVKEMKLVHQLYLEYIQYVDPSHHKKMPENVRWMKGSTQQSLMFSFPQDRNMHQNIFGGWLMKQAFELGIPVAFLLYSVCDWDSFL
jgi:acyl-coenzyme A thioesterase 9